MVDSVLVFLDYARVVGCFEDLLEVELLAFISDVDASVCVKGVESIVDGCHVC